MWRPLPISKYSGHRGVPLNQVWQEILRVIVAETLIAITYYTAYSFYCVVIDNILSVHAVAMVTSGCEVFGGPELQAHVPISL